MWIRTVLAIAVLAALARADGPMDVQIVAEDLMGQKIDFFDPRVFDYVFYVNSYPSFRDRGITSAREARRHWIQFGIKEGLRASPNFSPEIYLHGNRDVEDLYGPDNYPMAVVHYLTKGVHETYRVTGGPSRIPFLDDRVFDAKFYLEKNTFLRQSGVDTYEKAANHWKDFGVDKGLQASPNFWVKDYLEKNPDLLELYGPENYRAALSHWLDKGYMQTWRPNGGTTCKFWADWCQGQDSVTHKAISIVPPLPVFNYSGLPDGFVAPAPQNSGFSVTINDRDCSDLVHKKSLPQTSSRVEYVMHMHFAGKAGDIRPCNVFVRHYVDIQTRVQGKSVPELSLTHWNWEAANQIKNSFLVSPLKDDPPSMTYAGYSWNRPAPGYDTNSSTYNGPMTKRFGILNYTISAFRMEDPLSKSDDDDTGADSVPRLQPREIWNVVHHWTPNAGAPLTDEDAANAANGGSGSTSSSSSTVTPVTTDSAYEIINSEFGRRKGASERNKYQQDVLPALNIPVPPSSRTDAVFEPHSREKTQATNDLELARSDAAAAASAAAAAAAAAANDNGSMEPIPGSTPDYGGGVYGAPVNYGGPAPTGGLAGYMGGYQGAPTNFF